MNLLIIIGIMILATALLGIWGFIGSLLICLGIIFVE